MKSIRFVTTVALAMTALIFVYAQTRQTVAVTTQTLSAHTASNPYLVDLTRSGKIYNFAAGLDHNRIRLRTENGEMGLSDYVRKVGITGTSFLMGTESDLSAINYGATGGIPPARDDVGSAVKCAADYCSCIAGTDCKDMAKAKLCINSAWTCYKPIGKQAWVCMCIAKTVRN